MGKKYEWTQSSGVWCKLSYPPAPDAPPPMATPTGQHPALVSKELHVELTHNAT